MGMDECELQSLACHGVSSGWNPDMISLATTVLNSQWSSHLFSHCSAHPIGWVTGSLRFPSERQRAKSRRKTRTKLPWLLGLEEAGMLNSLTKGMKKQARERERVTEGSHGAAT